MALEPVSGRRCSRRNRKWQCHNQAREGFKSCERCAAVDRKHKRKRCTTHLEAVRKTNRRSVWKCSGLDPDEAQEVWDRGECALCGRKDGRLSVDHDHKTGRIRGLLCDLHNRGLGYFQDDPQLLRDAADYVETEGVQPRKEKNDAVGLQQ